MDDAAARARVEELRAAELVPTAELDALWAQLPPLDAQQMIGEWTGDEFRTGHPMNGRLAQARWYGKTMRSISDVDPIVCRTDDGSLANDARLSRGGASLWNVEFRGEVTATMVYDGVAVFDHFKRVDDDTVLGVMNGKTQCSTPELFYFLLERVR